MKVREHRGGFADSMATVAEIEPTKEALAKFISEREDRSVKTSHVKVSKYGFDNRIGWNTYIVESKEENEWGVFGFTDGPLIKSSGTDPKAD